MASETFISAEFRKRIERIYLFAKIDHHIRYYGSKLGILWAFLNPFFQIITYYFAFSYLIFKKKDPSFIPYLFTGVITWQFFSETTKTAITLFQKQKYLLQNTQLCKEDFFYSLLGSKFWAYLINFTIFILIDLLLFSPNFSTKLFYLFPIWIGLILFSLGMSFFLATIYIYLRDLDHLWSIFLKAGFWMVPVIWDYHIIYEKYSFMLYFPITTFVINIRQVALYDQNPGFYFMFIGIATSAIFALAGYYFMKRNSRKAFEIL